MSASVDLYGMDFSVYVRIARLTLEEKGVDYRLLPLNPFADDPPDPNRDLHPFGKMPVLIHDGARVIETQAIIRYVDEMFDGPALQSADPMARSRQNQILGICDSYLYKALVWGLFVEVLRKPIEGGKTDPAVVEQALSVTDTAFSVIESLLPVDESSAAGLTHFYLYPILDYGLRVEAAAALFTKHPRLCETWHMLRGRASIPATEAVEFSADLPKHVLP